LYETHAFIILSEKKGEKESDQNFPGNQIQTCKKCTDLTTPLKHNQHQGIKIPLVFIDRILGTAFALQISHR
jgi:hypothetical protein